MGYGELQPAVDDVAAVDLTGAVVGEIGAVVGLEDAAGVDGEIGGSISNSDDVLGARVGFILEGDVGGPGRAVAVCEIHLEDLAGDVGAVFCAGGAAGGAGSGGDDLDAVDHDGVVLCRSRRVFSWGVRQVQRQGRLGVTSACRCLGPEQMMRWVPGRS